MLHSFQVHTYYLTIETHCHIPIHGLYQSFSSSYGKPSSTHHKQMGFRKEKRSRRSVRGGGQSGHTGFRGGSWWNDFSTSVSEGYTKANSNAGTKVYRKAICEAPYRGARAMSSAYTTVPFSPTLNCSKLSKDQKESFNSWQDGSPGFCGDNLFKCNTDGAEPTMKKSNGFFTSSDLGAGRSFRGGNFARRSKKRHLRGGSSCTPRSYRG